MSKILKWITGFSFAATVITALLYGRTGGGICLSLAITFGTTFYHLVMRMVVGTLYHVGMKNHADYTKKWYQIHSWESRLYRFLHVKQWKDKMPTYNPEFFSFIPLIASKWFGSFWVFFITSVCGAIFDLLFVIMQRYNGARIIKITLRKK